MAPQRPKLADALPKSVEPSVSQPNVPKPLYAALDLGTNSCRMLIAEPFGDKFRVVDSFSKTVQLGAGLEKTGRLSRASMNKTLHAMRICQKKLRRHKVRKMRMVATEACRRARNGTALMRQIKRETGLNLDIINAEEEARLAVVSCAPLVSQHAEQVLIVDIGGGSTELVWIDLTTVAPANRRKAIMDLKHGLATDELTPDHAHVVDWISVPLGVATLREQFNDVEDDAGRFALMSLSFEEQLEAFAPYDLAHSVDGFQMIGTSGTVTTVAASHLGLRRYDRTKVDGLRLTSPQIEAVIAGYLRLGPEGRRNDPRIGRDRHALIMSGVAILQALIRTWPTDKLSVADRGLREGLLYAQMSADDMLEETQI